MENERKRISENLIQQSVWKFLNSYLFKSQISSSHSHAESIFVLTSLPHCTQIQINSNGIYANIFQRKPWWGDLLHLANGWRRGATYERGPCYHIAILPSRMTLPSANLIDTFSSRNKEGKQTDKKFHFTPVFSKLMRRTEIMHIKCLPKWLTHNKHLRHGSNYIFLIFKIVLFSFIFMVKRKCTFFTEKWKKCKGTKRVKLKTLEFLYYLDSLVQEIYLFHW